MFVLVLNYGRLIVELKYFNLIKNLFVGLLCVFCDNYIYIIKFSLLNFVNFFFKNILLWIL